MTPQRKMHTTNTHIREMWSTKLVNNKRKLFLFPRHLKLLFFVYPQLIFLTILFVLGKGLRMELKIPEMTFFLLSDLCDGRLICLWWGPSGVWVATSLMNILTDISKFRKFERVWGKNSDCVIKSTVLFSAANYFLNGRWIHLPRHHTVDY